MSLGFPSWFSNTSLSCAGWICFCILSFLLSLWHPIFFGQCRFSLLDRIVSIWMVEGLAWCSELLASTGIQRSVWKMFLYSQLLETLEVIFNSSTSTLANINLFPVAVQWFMRIGQPMQLAILESPLDDTAAKFQIRKLHPYWNRFYFLLWYSHLPIFLEPGGVHWQTKAPFSESFSFPHRIWIWSFEQVEAILSTVSCVFQNNITIKE